MSDPDKIIARLVYGIIFALSVFSIIVSPFLEKSFPLTSYFLKELGIAGVISLIIIFTIERFTREKTERAADRLVERINSNLFHAIYNRYIPNQAFQEVEKVLLNCPVFRTNHEVYYTIQNIDQQMIDIDYERYVQCELRSHYKIRNITDGKISYPIRLELEKPIDENYIKHCKINSIRINDKDLTTQEIDDHTKITDTQKIFLYHLDIKKDEEIEVQTTSQLLKQKTDQELWASKIPSDGISITVSIPGGDFHVNAHALHREELKTRLNTNVTKKWVLNHAMIPYQSVAFWWQPV